ncbi:MAG: helix-turn-helix transcriptional regulator [Bradymonadia bacterium]
MKRTERLFAIAEYLRGRRTGTTAEALAERFGVSLRTIYRDLDSLRSADLPVVGERGRGGGLALDRSYSLPPVNFTAREAALLVASGEWLLKARVIPFTQTLSRGLDKVRGALPPALQGELRRLQHALAFTGVPALASPETVRAALEAAWFEGHPLRIHYNGARGYTWRRVKIRQIVMTRSEVLLNCDDLDLEAPRQFMLHKIVEAEVLDG